MRSDSEISTSSNANSETEATKKKSGTRWTSKTAWIWTILSLLTLVIFICSSGQVDVRLILLVLTLSSSFVIIAHSYRRFLVGNRERPADFRENDIRAFANSPRAHVPEGKSSEYTAEKLKAEFDSEYSVRAYTMCVIPAVAIAIIGWTLLLVPVDQLVKASGDEWCCWTLTGDARSNRDTAVKVESRSDEGSKADPSDAPEPQAGNEGDAGTADDGSLAGTATALNPGVDEGSEVDTPPNNQHDDQQSLGEFEPLVVQAMGIGFLGATVFCFQLIWQRLTTEDLKPSIFLRCAMAMFFGLVFTFVVFSATESFSSDFGGEGAPMVGTGALIGYVVAFALGYFPMLAISWFTRIANKSLGEPSRRSDAQRLLAVDGITVFHEERLLEEGIHNLHDLAFADVSRLLIRTPYTARQLFDWVDQSLLLLHLDVGESESFRRGGIRNAENFLRVWGPLYGIDPTEAQRGQYALMLQTTPQRLDCIFAALQTD